jgi:hypothetical protein
MKQGHRGRLRALAEREVSLRGRTLNGSHSASPAATILSRAASYDVGGSVSAAGVRARSVPLASIAPVYAWGLPAEEPSRLTWPPQSSNGDASRDAAGLSYVSRTWPASVSTAPQRDRGHDPRMELDEADVEAALGEVFGRPVEPTASALTADLDRKWEEARTASLGKPPAATVAEPEKPLESSHEVFERMGQSMAFANNFNLGRVAIDRHFDALEQGVDFEWSAPTPVTARAMSNEIDDLDLVAELSTLATLDAERQAHFRQAPLSPPTKPVTPPTAPVMTQAPPPSQPADTQPVTPNPAAPQAPQAPEPTIAPRAAAAPAKPTPAVALPTNDIAPADASPAPEHRGG